MNTPRILKAQKALTTSFDPFEDTHPLRQRGLSKDRIEAGAMAIYGRVTRTDDPAEIRRKWATVAKPLTKDRHRAEAEACLRAAN